MSSDSSSEALAKEEASAKEDPHLKAKTVLLLRMQMKGRIGDADVRVGRRPVSCRCGLPEAEGRKGDGAWRRSQSIGENRVMERRVIRDLQANAPTLPFGRRNAARQAGSGPWSRASAPVPVAILVGWESRSRCRSGNGGHLAPILQYAF